MLRQLQVRLRRVSRHIYILIVAGLFVIGGLMAGWYFYEQNRLYTRADTGAALVTADLRITAIKLRDTFGLTADRFDSKANSQEYLAHLRRMQDDCKKLETYHAKTKQTDNPDALSQYLAKSNEICLELTKLTKDGITLTEAVQPVISLNSRIKLYETLPIISGSVRSGYEKTVNQTLDQLPDKIRFIDSKTQSKEYLQQLRNAIKANRGLDFFPAVAVAQQNFYGERQRYWNGDADLGNLIRAMDTFLERYCAVLPDTEHLSVCKKSTN